MKFARLDLLWVIAPLVAVVLVVRWRRPRKYFTHPHLLYLKSRIRSASRLVYLPRYLEFLAMGLLIVAVLDPVLPASQRLIAKKGLDLIMVVDLSSSMQEPIDLKGAMERRRLGMGTKEKDRLGAVKEAMADFVARRRDDRLAVVVFSENGYVVTPMTFDSAYVQRYLRLVDGKTLANEGQTAIGEGILTSLDLSARQGRDPQGTGKGKVMIVLTDGENNTGRDVYQAIARAREDKFKIHFIGVEVEKARDAPRLIAAVEGTGGNYYDVRDAKQLEEAYADINRTEKGTFLVKSLGKQVPWFYPFALASLGVLALSLALRAIPYFVEVT
jgi:Ca-activated chloride channel family protein